MVTECSTAKELHVFMNNRQISENVKNEELIEIAFFVEDCLKANFQSTVCSAAFIKGCACIRMCVAALHFIELRRAWVSDLVSTLPPGTLRCIAKLDQQMRFLKFEVLKCA